MWLYAVYAVNGVCLVDAVILYNCLFYTIYMHAVHTVYVYIAIVYAGE